jgi:hypothetical protein
VEGSGHGPVLGSAQLLLDDRCKNQFSSFAILAVGDSSVRHCYAILRRLLAYSLHSYVSLSLPLRADFCQRSVRTIPPTYSYNSWGPMCVKKNIKLGTGVNIYLGALPGL